MVVVSGFLVLGLRFGFSFNLSLVFGFWFLQTHKGKIMKTCKSKTAALFVRDSVAISGSRLEFIILSGMYSNKLI